VVDLSIDDALQWCSCFCYYQLWNEGLFCIFTNFPSLQKLWLELFVSWVASRLFPLLLAMVMFCLSICLLANMRIAMEKSGLVLAVKKLHLQRSNNIRCLIFVLFVRLSFRFHGSWRKAQFIFLTNAVWNLLIEVSVSRRFSCQETRMGSEPCIHSVGHWISIWILYYLESRCPKQGLLRPILTFSNDLFTITSVLRWICCRVYFSVIWISQRKRLWTEGKWCVGDAGFSEYLKFVSCVHICRG